MKARLVQSCLSLSARHLEQERLTVRTDDSLVQVSRVDARKLRGTLRYIETGKTFPIEFAQE